MVFSTLKDLKDKSDHLFPEYLRFGIGQIYTSHLRRYDFILITDGENYKTNDEKDLIYYLKDAKKFVLVIEPLRFAGRVIGDLWSPDILLRSLKEKYEEED